MKELVKEHKKGIGIIFNAPVLQLPVEMEVPPKKTRREF